MISRWLLRILVEWRSFNSRLGRRIGRMNEQFRHLRMIMRRVLDICKAAISRQFAATMPARLVEGLCCLSGGRRSVLRRRAPLGRCQFMWRRFRCGLAIGPADRAAILTPLWWMADGSGSAAKKRLPKEPLKKLGGNHEPRDGSRTVHARGDHAYAATYQPGNGWRWCNIAYSEPVCDHKKLLYFVAFVNKKTTFFYEKNILKRHSVVTYWKKDGN